MHDGGRPLTEILSVHMSYQDHEDHSLFYYICATTLPNAPGAK